MAREFNKIIVPIDGSKVAKEAAKKAIYLSKETGVELVLVHVIEIPYMPSVFEDSTEIPYMDILELLKQQGKKFLQEIETMAKKYDVSIKQKILEGHPAEEIIKLAQPTDLIVLGKKGMTALDRIFLGSVTENVAHHAPCPIMIVK
ncbi:MAG: universal stress protein [Thermoplasmatota archaeon]